MPNKKDYDSDFRPKTYWVYSDQSKGDVEIAKVTIESVTGNAISIRARWDKGKIQYTIVDPYKTEYFFSPETSNEPLTMAGIVQLIDSVERGEEYRMVDVQYKGLVIPTLQHNYEVEPSVLRGLRGFVSVDSPFYPELSGWYDEVFEEWYADKLRLEAKDSP